MGEGRVGVADAKGDACDAVYCRQAAGDGMAERSESDQDAQAGGCGNFDGRCTVAKGGVQIEQESAEEPDREETGYRRPRDQQDERHQKPARRAGVTEEAVEDVVDDLERE